MPGDERHLLLAKEDVFCREGLTWDQTNNPLTVTLVLVLIFAAVKKILKEARNE